MTQEGMALRIETQGIGIGARERGTTIVEVVNRTTAGVLAVVSHVATILPTKTLFLTARTPKGIAIVA